MTFPIRRGVNIGGWLSQRKGRLEDRAGWFTRDDVARAADLGFDHLRLPIDETQFWDEDGNREPVAWDLLNRCLDWCREADLRAVVDLHILRCHYFNAPERPLFTEAKWPGVFANLWRDLSKGLRERPNDWVAYELMNEPVADDPEDWNRVYPAAYEAIREAEPERTIILGSNEWSQARTMAVLRVPEGDPHLVLTYHYYNSMLITHYQARFVDACARLEAPIRYPGIPIAAEDYARLDPETRAMAAKWNLYCGPEMMAAEMRTPLEVRARTGLPLYCGEFGVIGNAPGSVRAAWLRDLVRTCETLGVAWAVWTWKGGFGMYDADGRRTAALDGVLAGFA